MRLSGFASGMDINQMVGDLMKAERQPLQKMQQDQQELILKMADYREVNREFMQFRNNTFDGVMRRSSMDSKQVTSSNEAAVSGTAGAGAANGTYTISNVERAQSAYNFSDDRISTDDEFDPSQSLYEQRNGLEGDFTLNEEGEIEFGMTTFDESGDPVEVEFSFDQSDSLNDILGAINTSELGVQTFYDNNSQQVSISRTETGVFNPNEDGQEIVFGTANEDGELVGSGFLTGTLQLNQGSEAGAQNATFQFNGLDMERQSNDFEINGVNISLNNEFTDPVTLNVANNTDEIFDTVMDFVDEYNELIEMVDGKVSQEYYRDYAPLTDEQRREMSESEVEMWEERAHSGLVRNDRMLTGALNQMRQDFYTPVNPDDPNQSFSQVTEIGITTTSNYQDRGRLEVDEAQLRSAIEQDPEAVYQMFASDGEETEDKGIARRIRDSLSGSIDLISNRAGRSEMASNQQFTIGREIDQAEDRISNFERRMQQVEERHWAQFTAMEQAMAQANAQAEQMMSQMGGMGQQM
ncbi:flagellar capping protein [Salipaludibacillus keqinensis]|uniref:Flagellar hook-associated protein 2 n=1 Tax=Salipaludibacillus keqinensis TaxID=2045207 RepID=A0A323TBT5_9BACI|nr:flagellar hook-associated protein 2 [Salipaludibacillus keqinensis]PYZ92812.1 flagellar capping protein [Salipaludibacillus keqinensis]